MSDNTLYRIGGVAGIIGLGLSLLADALPAMLGIGALGIALFVFALARLLRSVAPTLSLVALAAAIGGALILFVLTLFVGKTQPALQNGAIWALWFAPPLLLGIAAYRHPQSGFPRILALSGIVAGIAGLINLALTMLGGGDWANPNNPALGPMIMGAYYVAALFTLVWLIWSATVLMRRNIQQKVGAAGATA